MKVLIAEDDRISMRILERTLQNLGHRPVLARDGGEAWKRLVEESPDVIICDRVMPGMDGIDICRRLRAIESASYTYFIFLTALDDKRDVVEGMEAGADDYLTKPIDGEALAARLIAAARVTSLYRRLKEQNAELERLGRESFEAARTDPLTCLGNRLRLRDDLEGLCSFVERYERALTAALCDVDHFKSYNDRYGHLAGDAALVAVAKALRTTLREADRIYRFGGEELLVLLPEQTAASAKVAMERALLSVAELGIPHVDNPPLGVVTMSVGLAELCPSDKPPWESWLKRADEALYQAKALGRNKVSIFGAPSFTAPSFEPPSFEPPS